MKISEQCGDNLVNFHELRLIPARANAKKRAPLTQPLALIDIVLFS